MSEKMTEMTTIMTIITHITNITHTTDTTPTTKTRATTSAQACLLSLQIINKHTGLEALCLRHRASNPDLPLTFLRGCLQQSQYLLMLLFHKLLLCIHFL